MKIYLVGGAVRDKLLGRPVKDRDWVVVGATPDEMLDAGYTQVGADFPVYLHPHSGEEYALARQERKVGNGYHGFETTYDTSVTLEDDLWRRDLTINAMAIDPETDEVIDPFNGLTDLRNGVLRHVSDAFKEDPVRVLRVARFASRYGFYVHIDTYLLMRNMVGSGELNHLTSERVWSEFSRAMMEADPRDFFGVLHEIGANQVLFPELDCVDIWRGDSPLNIAVKNGSTLEERVMVMMSTLEQTDIDAFFEKYRVQTSVKTMVERYRDTLYRMRNIATAEKVLSLLKPYAFRDEEAFFSVCKHLAMVGHVDSSSVSGVLHAYDAAASVTFDSLSDEQQSTLKGKEIGAAIDELRKEAIAKRLVL